jgi:hypothetical protein
MRIFWLTVGASAAIWAIAAEPATALTDVEDIPDFVRWNAVPTLVREDRPAEAAPVLAPSRRTAGEARRESAAPPERERRAACVPPPDGSECTRRRTNGAIPDGALIRQRQTL